MSCVTGLTQLVVSVWGKLPEVVKTTSGLPGLVKVKVFEPNELTRMLVTRTDRGNVIVPMEPPFWM